MDWVLPGGEEERKRVRLIEIQFQSDDNFGH